MNPSARGSKADSEWCVGVHSSGKRVVVNATIDKYGYLYS